jgi:hypothetical protein
MEIPDITKMTWQLNVALIGAIFSVFSLIYNPHFIYYGFYTFLFGVISHIFNMFYDIVKKMKIEWWLAIQTIFIVFWVVAIVLKYR